MDRTVLRRTRIVEGEITASSGGVLNAGSSGYEGGYRGG